MIETLVQFFAGVPKELSLIIISMLPVVELRGGIVAAKLMGEALSIAFPICILGNMIPIPFILLFLDKIFKWLRGFPKLHKILDYVDRKAEKNKVKVEKWKLWGLLILVAIPLPGTGAWTGSLVANVLNIPFKKSFPVIFGGVVIAGILMSVFSYFIPGLFGY